MTVESVVVEELIVVAEPEVADMSSAERLKLYMLGGAGMALLYFADPAAGLINIPVSFFMQHRLHLTSNALAVFKVWIALPLIFSFVFGFLRDQWSPFGLGDRGHLMVFGVATAAIYGVISVLNPSYGVLLAGMIIATCAFQFVGSAAAGLLSAIGREGAMAGRMAVLFNITATGATMAAALIGGILSGVLEGQGAVRAARILFWVAAGLMLAMALFGLVGPKTLFGDRAREPASANVFRDMARLARHWPVYPVMLIQMLWQFAPASGTVLQYHITNTLHASDAQWGLWNAIFLGSFVPVFIGYGFLCKRVVLSRLLWAGFVLAVFQMTPLLMVHSAVGALIAAAPMGIIGGIGQGALVDLVIRSSPKGLQGTVMMLFSVSVYWFSVRLGDLLGTDIYDHHGGFIPAVVVTIIVYALILPVLLLVPKRLTATKDGEALDVL